MFATIHRQDELTELGFKRLMNKHKRSIQKTIQRSVPEHHKAMALAKRFEEHGESYFLFVDDASIAPTNNEAEQNIRTLVMDRIVTQGTRSDVTQGTRSDMGNGWHGVVALVASVFGPPSPPDENRDETSWHFFVMRFSVFCTTSPRLLYSRTAAR